MGILDKLLGRSAQRGPEATPTSGPSPAYGAGQQGAAPQPGGAARGEQLTDEQAVERYQYLLRTAPPERIEQAHEEAFARLTPEQRQQVLTSLSEADPNERPRDDSPQSLARSATRMEVQRPGTLQSAFGGRGMGGRGGGMGGLGMGIGGMLLTSVAGAFVGTAIADAMFDMGDGMGEGGDQAGDGGDAGGDQGDAGGDMGGGDLGGEAQADGFGDTGGFGDFGGGDFGGGDFGF